MTVREIRSRNWVWLVSGGALVAALGSAGTGVSARTETSLGLPIHEVQRSAAPQGQSATPPGTAKPDSGRPQDRQPFGVSFEWWNDEAVKKEVGLTEDKVKKINDIHQERMRQMKPSADEWLKQFDLLNKMTAERMADAETYAIQVNRVESLAMRLRESRTLMLYRMYKQLQPDQYQRLRAALERVFDRNGRGRGGAPHTR